MRQNRKNWSHEEDESIINLVKKYGTKRWTLISQKMRERFPEDGRSGKQCRERWHNHLSPIINKQPWSQEQIKIVFDSHRKFGNRWTQIAQLLEGRTDNAVKNQFYSTLRKGLRRICKILGTRNSTTRIKKIKPTVLSSLISNITQIPIGQDENEQQLYDLLFQFSNGDRYEELKQKAVNDKYKQKMERLLQKILDAKDFNLKKKSRPKIQKTNIIQQNQQGRKKQLKQVQKIKTAEKQICNENNVEDEEQQNNKFQFNLILESEHQQNNNYFQINASPNIQGSLYDQGYDYRIDRPISLKKENSQIQPKQQYHPLLKKKSSEPQKNKKVDIFEIENNENSYRGFLSKSPNFSSKFKMPTPRLHQNPHPFTFVTYGEQNILKNDEPEKYYNDFVEQIKNKMNSRLDRERLR